MFKIIGSIMIIASSVIIGIHFKGGLIRRTKSLENFIYMLDFISREISIKLTPIPEIFMQIPKQNSLLEFIDTINKKISKDEESLTYKWIGTVDEFSEKLSLADSDRKILNNLGSVLGRYSGEEQLKSIKYARKSLEYNLKSARAELLQKGNVYKVSSICVGIILVLCFV